LSGKVVAITGTSPDSIGFHIAEAAVRKHAKYVLLLNRESTRSVKAEAAIKELAGDNTIVHTVPIDLLSFDAVKKAASQVNKIAKAEGGLDVLCCNAGIMAQNDERTVDGFNVEVQADHLSHSLLTHLCMSSLEQASKSRGDARVVYQSSSARFGDPLEAKYFERSEPNTLGGAGLKSWGRYHQAKLANAAFAMALHDSLVDQNSNVKAIGCEPGYATSNLASSSAQNGRMTNLSLNMLHLFGASQSPADGSLCASVACFGNDVDSGDFYTPGGRLGMTGAPKKTISKGTAVAKKGEKEATLEKNKKTIMSATIKALGLEAWA